MKILVIEALGLHLGYLGCYGNDWVATPNLDRLAAEGIVFDTHIIDQPELRAVTPWSQRSVGTACYALPGERTHSASVLQPRVVRVESLPTFAAETLAAIDENESWHWIEGPSLLPPWNLDDELLDAYFDEDDVAEGLAPWPDPPLDLITLNEADALQLQNTYAAAVTVFDAQLGALLERLPLEDVLLCVTARSGLPLGEHGMIGAPRPWLHDELVHVPLILRMPKAADAGLRVSALTQPVDLLPTFMEILGQPLQRRGLWPLLRGEVTELRSFAFAAMRVGAFESWLMRTMDAAFHLHIAQPEHEAPRAPQLFLKPEDRWEVNDMCQRLGDTAEDMERALRAFAEEIKQPIAPSER